MTSLGVGTIVSTLVVALVSMSNSVDGVNVSDQCVCGRGSLFITGYKVLVDRYPWMIYVRAFPDGMDEVVCAGSIINDRYILTAARCLNGVTDPKNVWAFRTAAHTPRNSFRYMKEYDLSLKIKGIKIGKTNNLALLELEKQLVGPALSPICLSRSPAEGANNLFAAGWGVQEDDKVIDEHTIKNELDDTNILMEAPLRTYPHDKCVEGKNTSVNHDTQVCVKGRKASFNEPEPAVCRGDTGGPLMTSLMTPLMTPLMIPFMTPLDLTGQTHQLGVLVDPTDCTDGNTKDPAIYERILAHKDWIQQNTQDAIWCQGSTLFKEGENTQ